MYIIVYCGYEGLDRVLWAGEDGAKESCLRVRERITDNMKRVDLPPRPGIGDYEDVEDWHIARDEWQKLKEEAWGAIGKWFWESMDDPDKVCVMKDVGDFEYRCCCKELGVGIGKYWLY